MGSWWIAGVSEGPTPYGVSEGVRHGRVERTEACIDSRLRTLAPMSCGSRDSRASRYSLVASRWTREGKKSRAMICERAAVYSSSSSTVWRLNDRLGAEAGVDEDGSDMAVALNSVSIYTGPGFPRINGI